jgi:sugar fermentation stimulation protein A
VELDGACVKAHVPNSGRLHELFIPGQPVLLAHRPAAHRVTDYDLVMVRLGDTLVSMDARLPSRLFQEAVEQRRIDAFADYSAIVPEVVFGASRLDFRLEGGHDMCYVEVKSVTLVEDDCGLFPDAPTERGQRHLDELITAQKQGCRAAAVFVIQRPDARRFRPHPTADPAFAGRLRAASAAGVEVYAFTCDVSPERVAISDRKVIIEL